MSLKYYRHLPRWPNFVWTEAQRNRLPVTFRDQIAGVDGDLPAASLPSWREFHSVVADARFQDDEWIFRGQRHHAWDLIPSLARGETTYNPAAATRALESFRNTSRGRKDPDRVWDDPLELWALGQHHGLRTPLLDWTFSAYVALFFAFAEDDHDDRKNHSRAVFALNKTRVDRRVRELLDDGWVPDQVVSIFQPTGESNHRLLSQSGVFLFVPPNESVTSWVLTHLGEDCADNNELSHCIMKIHIPNQDRGGCLRALRQMNIHHASLFPDLIGSAQYTNFQMRVYPRLP